MHMKVQAIEKNMIFKRVFVIDFSVNTKTFFAFCWFVFYAVFNNLSLVPFANKFPKNMKLYKLMTIKPGESA